MRKTIYLLIVGAAALSACGGQAEAPASAASESAERKIYIDPETGERLSEPPLSDEPAPASQTSRSDREPEIIEREDGSKMIIHQPDDWPELKARKSPDGSISIEHPAGDQQ